MSGEGDSSTDKGGKGEGKTKGGKGDPPSVGKGYCPPSVVKGKGGCFKGKGKGGCDKGKPHSVIRWEDLHLYVKGKGGLVCKGKGKGKGGCDDTEMHLYGKGKGGCVCKGKGKGKGGCDDTDLLPEDQKNSLTAQLLVFKESSQQYLALSASLSSSERKYVHEIAEEMGLVSQYFGRGVLHIFRGSDDAGGFEVSIDPGLCKADYSCVVLDGGSQLKLETFYKEVVLAGNPWFSKPDMDHMRICLGPLHDPKAEDAKADVAGFLRHLADRHGLNEEKYLDVQGFADWEKFFISVAGRLSAEAEDSRLATEALINSVSGLKLGQPRTLKVVSIGVSRSCVAVGVVGCPSLDQPPHVMLTFADSRSSRRSSAVVKDPITRWTPVPKEQQVEIRGVVWMRGPTWTKYPPAPYKPPNGIKLECSIEAASALGNEAVMNSVRKCILACEANSRPKTLKAFGNLMRRGCVSSAKIYIIHPVELAKALDSSNSPFTDKEMAKAVIEAISDQLRPTDWDPACLLHARGGNDDSIPARTLERIQRLLPGLIRTKKEMTKPPCIAQWIKDSAYISVDVEISTIVEKLKSIGVLSVNSDDKIEFHQPEEKMKDSGASVPYTTPWGWSRKRKAESED